ncbi:hypothetical protein I8935_07330 [Campylobacter coli]|uniref:Bacteriocin n=3 Tax=Campylobacter coli TaxID=195 RepID=A0A5T0J336_CAMCO|nr:MULTISPECIES: hypothetical protein [Campylobacter]EAH7322551.1 hypothetical protein [Campylobacter jejuni]AGV09193.1 hypothetical protein G157_00260 [Campylobacter coli CVM N29710]APT19413.1 hypothetical protein BU815_00345 [Campylobacter coli]EAC1194990.1 hypothetical protein [Campylobacter coli]EAC1233989.1 hypothetical protein [Campylobacter coli]
MKTLSNIIILSALLINFSFANDLLAKLSNGAVSDNSQGVKALSLDEMKQVKGGYAAQNRMAPFLVGGGYWLARQGAMWGVRYAAWGVFSERHPLNSGVGSKGWRY